MSLQEFMAVEKTVNRWFVLKVAVIGAFFGALLAIGVSMVGLAV